jgi:hypothetical protein
VQGGAELWHHSAPFPHPKQRSIDGTFESLLVLPSPLPATIIASPYDPTTGRLEFFAVFGSAPHEDFEVALEAVGYLNTSNSPEMLDRIIEIVAIDELNLVSNAAISTIRVIPIP